MLCRPLKKFACLAIPVFILWLMVSAVAALDLNSEFKISLKEKDRILGSLEGNFVVYGRPHITMYNVMGKPVFSRKLKNNIKPTLSPNGKILGLITYADHSPTELETLSLEIFNQAGQSQWKMSDPAPNAFMINDNGTIFGIEGVQGISPTRIHLYDPYGDLLNILTIQNYHGIAIAPTGGKFIIDKARGGLDVYDSLGNFLDSLPVSKNYVFDHRDERYIATFFQGVLRLFQDEKEVVTFQSPELVIRDMMINVEKNIAVLMAAKRLEVYELTTKRQLWEYRLQEGKQWMSSLDVSDDARFIACGMDINGGNQVPKGKRHVEGYLLIFPVNGESMIRHKETYDLWAIGLPKGVFSPSSGSIMLETREKLEKFRLKP